MVIVTDRHAHAPLLGAVSVDRHARFESDLGKRAIAVIVVERVTRSRQPSGTTLHRNAFELARRALAERGQVVQIKANVIRYEQIQLAVIIVIQECSSSGPSWVANAGFRGNVRKGAIAVIS